jgi:hypothetical protein
MSDIHVGGPASHLLIWVRLWSKQIVLDFA